MLKLVMFLSSAASTVLRLVDLIYLSFQETTNLPTLVVIVTVILVLFGLYIIARQILGTLKFRELVLYFTVSVILLTTNIFYVAWTLPLALSPFESIAVGSVLEIIIDLILLFLSYRHLRTTYISVDPNKENDSEE